MGEGERGQAGGASTWSGSRLKTFLPNGIEGYVERNRELAVHLLLNKQITLERAAEMAAMRIVEFKALMLSPTRRD